MLDAVTDMIAEKLILDAAQRRADGGDLRDDVDAVAVVLDHAAEAADLSFDPGQSFQARALCAGLHGPCIPQRGTRRNNWRTN